MWIVPEEEEEEEIKPYVHSAILTYEDKSMFTGHIL